MPELLEKFNLLKTYFKFVNLPPTFKSAMLHSSIAFKMSTVIITNDI